MLCRWRDHRVISAHLSMPVRVSYHYFRMQLNGESHGSIPVRFWRLWMVKQSPQPGDNPPWSNRGASVSSKCSGWLQPDCPTAKSGGNCSSAPAPPKPTSITCAGSWGYATALKPPRVPKSWVWYELTKGGTRNLINCDRLHPKHCNQPPKYTI